jgi:ABC-2 type transport system permease protein
MTRFFAVALALGRRNIHNWLVSPALLVPSVAFPLFFLVAFAGGLSAVEDVSAFDYPPGYTAFQFVFIVLQASAFVGVFTGIAIAADFEAGFGRRLLLAAPKRLGIIAGYALGTMFRTIAIVLLLQFVGLAAGMQVDGGVVGLGGLYLLALITSLSTLLFAAGIALRTRTVQSGPAMQIPIFLVLFLAPVYVPRELLSGWIATAAQVNPFTPIVEAGRDLLAGRAVEAELAYGIALALLAVTAAWAIRGLCSAERAGG